MWTPEILVVDDDPDFVEVTRHTASAQGYEVARASNGKEALALMRRQPPDLVLLDIMMSYRLDGLDVAAAMRRDPALAGVPILMISLLPSLRFADIAASDAPTVSARTLAVQAGTPRRATVARGRSVNGKRTSETTAQVIPHKNAAIQIGREGLEPSRPCGQRILNQPC